MAHIHYRFSSKLGYDTAVFDSPNITLSNLKRQIMDRVKLRAGDCDLRITNAQTSEEYTDDDCLIPTGSSIIVRRIPIIGGRSSSKSHNAERSDAQLHHAYGASRAMDGQSSTKALSFFSKMQMANLVDADMSEEDKVKFMITQSSYESATCNTNLYTGLPANYACYHCGNAGHHIRNCPIGRNKNSETPVRIKKSTGIPRSFLVEVDDPNIKGAMMTNSGHYVISALDAEAYATGKKEKPPFIPQEQPKSESEDIPIPDELLCLICHDLLDDAVVIPCCGNSYCDDCIRSILLDSEDHVCPTCGQSEVSPDTLIANRFLRQTVNNFKKERGYTKTLRRRSGTSQSHNSTVTPKPVKLLLSTQSRLQKPHQSPDSQQDRLDAANTPALSQVSGFPPAATGRASAHSTASTSLQPEQRHLDEANANGKKEKPPFIPQEQPKSESEDIPIPDELLCRICHDLPDDAVVIPCCGNSYCDDCIRSILLDSEDHVCPTCGQSEVSPDTLIANRFLRQTVNNFKKERGYTKTLRRRSGTSQSHNSTVTPKPVKLLLSTQSRLQKPHQSPDSQQDSLLDHVEVANTAPLSQVSGFPPAATGRASAHSAASTSLQPEQRHLDETEGQTHDDSAAAAPSVMVSNQDPTAAPSQLIPLVDNTVEAEPPRTVSGNQRHSSSDPASSRCRDSSSSSSGCLPVASQQLSSSSSSSSYPAALAPLFTSPFFPTLLPAHQSHSSYPPGYRPTTPVWTLPTPQGSPIPSLISSPIIPPLIPKEWYQRKKKERSPHRGSSSRHSSSHSASKASKSSRSSSRSGSRSRSRSQSRSRPRSPDSRHRSRPSRPSCSYSYGYKRSRSPTPSSSSSPRVGYHSRSKSPSAHSRSRHHSHHHSHHHSRHHSKKSASSRYSSRKRGEHSGREAGGSGGSSARNKYTQHTNQTSRLELYRQQCLQWKEYKEWCEKYFSSNIGQFHQLPVPLLSLPPPPLPQCGDREGSRDYSPANFDSHNQPKGRRAAEMDGRSRSSESSSDSSSSPSQSSSDISSTPSQSTSDSHSSLSLKTHHSCSPLSQSSSDGRSTACVDGSQARAYPERSTENYSHLPTTPARNSEEVNLQEQSTDNKQPTLENMEDLSPLKDMDLWHCALSGVEKNVTGKEEEAERDGQEVAELALTSQKESAERESSCKEDKRGEPMEGAKMRMKEEDTVRSNSQSSQNKSHHVGRSTTADDSSSTSVVGSCGGGESHDRRTVVKPLEDTRDRPADGQEELALMQVPLSKWEKEDEGGQDEGEIRVRSATPPVALPHPSVALINRETEADNEQQRQRSMERERDRDRVTARGRDREKERSGTLSCVAPSSGKDRSDSISRDGETRKERQRDRERGRERQRDSRRSKERTREEERGRDRETKLERSSISPGQKRNLPSHSHSHSSTSQAAERRDRQRGGDHRTSTGAGRRSSSVKSRAADVPDYNANKTCGGASLHSKCEEKDGTHDSTHHNYKHHRPAGTHQSPPSLSHSHGKERDLLPSESSGGPQKGSHISGLLQNKSRNEGKVEKGERKRCREEDEADKLDRDTKWKRVGGGREAQQEQQNEQLVSKPGERQRRQEKRDEEEPKKAEKGEEAGRHRAGEERRAEETKTQGVNEKQGEDGGEWRTGGHQEERGRRPH